MQLSTLVLRCQRLMLAVGALATTAALVSGCTRSDPSVEPGPAASKTITDPQSDVPSDGAEPSDPGPESTFGALQMIPGSGAGRTIVLPSLLRLQLDPGGEPAIPVAGDRPDTVDGGDGESHAETGIACRGIVVREGDQMTLDGVPVTFFGINAQYLLRPEFPEKSVEPIVEGLAARGVNTIRVWFFHDQDPDRFERLLDVGERHGVRFVVVLGDNVFKGRDWFFSDEDEEDYRPHLERTVTRFKDRPEIMLWEVMNEPNCGDGGFDDGCLKTIKDWLTMSSRMVKAIDECRAVSSGMIGAGNYENELKNYRSIHKKDTIEMVSVHKRSVDAADDELELADDANRPVYFGEIFDRAYDDGCSPLDGGNELQARAERIKSDFRQALDDGVDGYMLWNFSAGTVEQTDGKLHHYCSDLGYELDDPVWDKLNRSGDLPPPVPWREQE